MFRPILKYLREFRDARVFFVNLSIIITLCIIIIFVALYMRTSNLLIDDMRQQAVSYLDLIVRVRSWNALHQGVYVNKSDSTPSNPFLKEVGIEPDISCSDNRILTLRNPSLMTKEISELTTGRKDISFHIASARPLNPQNAPDAFESGALTRFENGEREAWIIDRSGKEPIFRYMAPLTTEKSCIRCHGADGYKVGDIRGGISVVLPMRELDRTLRANAFISLGLGSATLGGLLSLVYFLGWRLLSRLERTQRQLVKLASTDELTGLLNRRTIMNRLEEEFSRSRRTGEPLGVIMLDLDHFKQVNDTHGHPIGDIVLSQLAERLSMALRQYDILGRIGGEEFFIICPATNPEDLGILAERLRVQVKSEVFRAGKANIQLTISIGITPLKDGDPGPDVMLRRSDRALYSAKRQGRDQVVSF